jgi:hypothetical protein
MKKSKRMDDDFDMIYVVSNIVISDPDGTVSIPPEVFHSGDEELVKTYIRTYIFNRWSVTFDAMRLVLPSMELLIEYPEQPLDFELVDDTSYKSYIDIKPYISPVEHFLAAVSWNTVKYIYDNVKKEEIIQQEIFEQLMCYLYVSIIPTKGGE